VAASGTIDAARHGEAAQTRPAVKRGKTLAKNASGMAQHR